MKALVAAFAAVSLSVLCAEPVSSTRNARTQGQWGRAGLSHFSGRPAHSSGSPAHFGRSGAHLKLGGHPFHGHRFGHHRHFEHKRLFSAPPSYWSPWVFPPPPIWFSWPLLRPTHHWRCPFFCDHLALSRGAEPSDPCGGCPPGCQGSIR